MTDRRQTDGNGKPTFSYSRDYETLRKRGPCYIHISLAYTREVTKKISFTTNFYDLPWKLHNGLA